MNTFTHKYVSNKGTFFALLLAVLTLLSYSQSQQDSLVLKELKEVCYSDSPHDTDYYFFEYYPSGILKEKSSETRHTELYNENGRIQLEHYHGDTTYYQWYTIDSVMRIKKYSDEGKNVIDTMIWMYYGLNSSPNSIGLFVMDSLYIYSVNDSLIGSYHMAFDEHGNFTEVYARLPTSDSLIVESRHEYIYDKNNRIAQQTTVFMEEYTTTCSYERTYETITSLHPIFWYKTRHAQKAETSHRYLINGRRMRDGQNMRYMQYTKFKLK